MAYASWREVDSNDHGVVDQRLCIYKPTHEKNFIVENGHDVSGLVPGPRSIIQFVCIVWREHRGLAAILKMAAKMLTNLHNMRYRQHTMKCLV